MSTIFKMVIFGYLRIKDQKEIYFLSYEKVNYHLKSNEK